MLEENKELEEVLNNISNKKIDTNQKLNKILNKIDEENSKLASNNQEMLEGITPPKPKRIEVEQPEKNEEEEEEEEENDDNDKDNDSENNNKNNGDNNNKKDNQKSSYKKIEVDFEEYSIVNTTKNCFIKLFSCLLPYKNNIKIIKIHYNTTILLIFKIYRFLVLMSFFGLIIFFFECIFHMVKQKDNLSEICKYSIPCFFQYSSFDISEAKVFSVTYGIWLIFFSICSLAYYYALSSDQEQQNIYFENNINTVGCRYLATSWNFNYGNEEVSKKCKNAIKEEFKLYAQKFTDIFPKENKDDECNYGFFCMIFLQVIYAAFIVIYFFMFILVFTIRDLLRNKSSVANTMETKDVLADIISFIIIPIFLRLFNKLTEIFPSFEGWEKSSHKYMSNFIKKIITTFVGFFSLIFIFIYFTLYTNTLEEAKLALFGSTQGTFFGCPGVYQDHRHTYHSFDINTLETKYQEVKASSYSKCREEELGLDFFFIFLFYFIFSFIIDLLKMCCSCCFDVQDAFDPINSMINVFSIIILYSITLFYIPYMSLIFPVITILVYKFQFYLLKHKKSYRFNESGLIKRNNTKYLRIIFLIFIIGLIVIQGFLYLLSYPHYYKVNCFSPNEGAGTFSVLLYNYNKEWCGPVRSYVRVSDVFTEAISDSPFFGGISFCFREIPFIIVILALVFIVLIYKNNYLDSRYNEYLRKKQRELDNTFRVYYEQISKRDLLTSMLLKVTKLKV